MRSVGALVETFWARATETPSGFELASVEAGKVAGGAANFEPGEMEATTLSAIVMFESDATVAIAFPSGRVAPAGFGLG